jgi:hypothetical protein
MRDDFTRLTGIPILDQIPTTPFSILNDPDTGVRLPNEKNQREGRTHVSIATIARRLRETPARSIVTFDQSDYRHSGLNRQQQRLAKIRALRQLGVHSFYYVSHAPFLFAFRQTEDRDDLKKRLIASGIPCSRFEDEETKAEP